MGPARKRLLLGLPILGVGCSLIAAPEDAHPTHPKRVLIVESYGRDITPWNVITPAFKNELARQWQTAIEFHESALETARNEESRAELAFVDYLRALYAKQPPDLVVPVGAAATQFWWRHLPVLFPSTPVVIGGIEHRLLKVLTLGANDTAVAIQFGNAQGGLDLIFQLLPATTNVVMVIGNSSLERFWMSECQESWTRFSERGQLVWYNTLSFPEICRRAAELPPRSILTYGIFWVDAAGVPHEQMRSLDQLSSVANAPIFGLFEEQLGHGIVGGRLISSESIGRETGRLAAQILRGESATNIPPRVLGASPPAFDWRELRRWNIEERLLPPDSVVMFRQIPVWQRYRGYIWSALTIIMLQAASILALALQRTRRRRAESAAQHLQAQVPATKLIFLTVNEDADFAREALAAGGVGYVVKARLGTDLLPALCSAVAGQYFISPCPGLADLVSLNGTLAGAQTCLMSQEPGWQPPPDNPSLQTQTPQIDP
ncbi:MAG TPA: hypothetical protein P5186_14915 [Candidatus Paceibacterota bacterium]|nr:hypothetical protein [Verrucomicrobiota bacterium]HRY49338.1 hypothetical protein [Candidatus Paceibacterota bacterium]HSA02381.1 hypothetical protein [Candidatus Paceibacterota bacterium]